MLRASLETLTSSPGARGFGLLLGLLEKGLDIGDTRCKQSIAEHGVQRTGLKGMGRHKEDYGEARYNSEVPPLIVIIWFVCLDEKI